MMTSKTKQQTRTITIRHDGFHGRHSVRIRVPADLAPGSMYELTPSQLRQSYSCRSSSCVCGESMARQDDHDRWVIEIPDGDALTIRGNYAQQ